MKGVKYTNFPTLFNGTLHANSVSAANTWLEISSRGALQLLEAAGCRTEKSRSRSLTVGSFPAIWHSSILLVDAGQKT